MVFCLLLVENLFELFFIKADSSATYPADEGMTNLVAQHRGFQHCQVEPGPDKAVWGFPPADATRGKTVSQGLFLYPAVINNKHQL